MTEHLQNEVIAELSEPSWWSLRWIQDIDSTNRELIRETNLSEGTVLVAEHQSAGRGRLERTWEASVAKSILCSVLLRPERLAPQYRPLLTIVMANSIVTVGRDLGAALDLKWPNDVGIAAQDSFQKVAGVLAEASNDVVVLGFGLNVLEDSSRPAGATSLEQSCDLKSSRPVILARILNEFLCSYRALQADGPAALLVEFEARCNTLGRQVRVEQTDGSWEGTARSIDSSGHLIVERDGADVVVAVGDVVHLRTIDKSL